MDVRPCKAASKLSGIPRISLDIHWKINVFFSYITKKQMNSKKQNFNKILNRESIFVKTYSWLAMAYYFIEDKKTSLWLAMVYYFIEVSKHFALN